MTSIVNYDVFVSYARSDGSTAVELNGWLRAQGFRTFFDRNELNPGLRWIPALEDAIQQSRAVAILVGAHGIGNTQQYERELALVRQTSDPTFPVIPVLLPGCVSPPTGFLQLVTWIDLRGATSVLHQTETLALLHAALKGECVAVSAVRASVCPYRGLEPFHEEDAPFFCGRDDAIHDLVAKVRASSFVAVVGPSGSGKSSLVFAGLLPALRQERQERAWDVVPLRPGASPLRALAAAFGSAPQNAGPAEIDAYLEKEAAFYRDGDVDMLTRIVASRLDNAPEKPDRLLIYVDQWEELYAMAPPAEAADRRQKHANDVQKFVALLVAAATTTAACATVVLTVRADFYNPLIRNPLLSKLLPQQQMNIPPMRPGDLRSVIERPAKAAGLSFVPPELVDRILNDVGSQEGRLPLLQFALKETWERREGNKLTAEAYTEVGGVAGAIEKTAEAAYARLTQHQKDAARRLFLRLVTPGEGQEDTRARSLIPEDPEQRDIVKLFSDPKIRLVVTGVTPLEGAGHQGGGDIRATVEVAHEALIRRWSKLREWVTESREKLRARAAIVRAIAEWEEKGKIDKFLLDPGVHLERGRDLVNDPGDVPVDDIRDYVRLSIQREQRRLDAERKREMEGQERELQLATELAALKAQLRDTESNEVPPTERPQAEAIGRPIPRPSVPFGPLAAFAGTWSGSGFNTIFRPQQTTTPLPFPVPNSDNILELNLTSESLSFSESLGSIPNRGTVRGDIFLNGVAYTRAVNDVTNPSQSIGIEFETGIWVIVPETTNPDGNVTVARMACTPHGTMVAQGIAVRVNGPPAIASIDITPSRNGTAIRFPSQYAANLQTARIPQDLAPFMLQGTITQGLLDDPNCMLRNHIAGQKIVSTTVLFIQTNPAEPVFGGVHNIAYFLGSAASGKPNFHNIMMAGVFWIETVEYVLHIPVFAPGQRPLIVVPEGPRPFGRPIPKFLVNPPIQIATPRAITVTSTQIQYSQTAVLSFSGLLWPHVSVATLVPADPIAIPPSVWN